MVRMVKTGLMEIIKAYQLRLIALQKDHESKQSLLVKHYPNKMRNASSTLRTG